MRGLGTSGDVSAKMFYCGVAYHIARCTAIYCDADRVMSMKDMYVW